MQPEIWCIEIASGSILSSCGTIDTDSRAERKINIIAIEGSLIFSQSCIESIISLLPSASKSDQQNSLAVLLLSLYLSVYRALVSCVIVLYIIIIGT